jgi:hypothetical protein
MQRDRKMFCRGMGFLLAALLGSPTAWGQAKPAAERGRDAPGSAPTHIAAKTKPEADRNGKNPFAGKILVIERNATFEQAVSVAMEKCEIVDVGNNQLLSGRTIEQPGQPNAGLKVSIPLGAIGCIFEFEDSEEYEEYQGRQNVPFGMMPPMPAMPQPGVAAQVFEIAPGPNVPVPGDPMPVEGNLVPFVAEGVAFTEQQPAGLLPTWVQPYFNTPRVTRFEDFAVERLSRDTREAAKALIRAGARVFILADATEDETGDTTSGPPEVIVVIGREWTGGDAELDHAGKIAALQGLYVLGPARVSDNALAKLREGHAGVEVERRSEARLGVSGKMHPKGLMAAFVDPNSAAAQAGIEPQDVIVELVGQPVPDVETYREVMVPLKPGEKVKMKVSRNGELMAVTVKLGRWE